MGDCVMCAWAATGIRLAHPDCELVWAVEERFSQVLDAERLLTSVYSLPRTRWKRDRWSPQTWRDQLVAYTRLRQSGFDYGIDLHGHAKSALLLKLSGANRRAACGASDFFSSKLNTIVGGRLPGMHNVEWWVEVTRALIDIPFPATPMMPTLDMERRMVRDQFDRARFATISVAATQPANRYSADSFRRVGELLLRSGIQPVYIGAPGVVFEGPAGSADLVGRLSLRESMAAIAESEVHISPDTGTGHLAAAYGVPVVSIFGPADPKVFRPYTDSGRVLIRGGSPDNISPEEVVSAAESLIRSYAA